MAIDIIVLICLVLAALWTVMTRSLLRSAIGLAATSALLSIIIFRLNSPLAAVFELSVCTGLISVLFISTISLTEPLTREQKTLQMRKKFKRFWYLPTVLVAVGVVLSMLNMKLNINLPAPEIEKDVRVVLWNLRQVDLLGQITILLAGVFGVVILFKEANKK